MEAIVGVWLTSVVGAAAFSVAGYVLGQRGASIPFLKLSQPPQRDLPLPPPLPPLPESIATTQSQQPAAVIAVATNPNPNDRTTPDFAATPMPPPLMPSSPPAGAGRYSKTPRAPDVALEADVVSLEHDDDDDDDDEEDRPTLVPNTLDQAAVLAAAVATIPPSPRTPSFKVGGDDLEATKSELRAALLRAETAAQRARAAEVVRAELERQIEALRADLKHEVVARATAESRAEELGDRLAGASEEASSLRHKVSLLDRQTKQLREALQGRVRALTTSEWHRRRDLEEADEIRVKLRDVYDKIERTTLPPEGMGGSSGSGGSGALGSDPSSSVPPQSQLLSSSYSDRPRPITSPGMPAAPRSFRPSTTSNDQDQDDVTHLLNVLRAENARLSSENHALRTQRNLTSAPPKPTASRDSVPELDLDIYRTLIERCGSVAGLRGAVIADELGSLLVGSGELAEGLAAFGAYIKDASARTDRLLPLDGVEEVDIRDRAGMLLCTRVVTRLPSELSLVLLGAADASIAAAKNIAEETLRLR